MTFLTILGATEILCSFRLVLEETTGKKILDPSKLEFSKGFSKQSCLSEAADNIYGSLNRGIPYLLLLSTLIAICQKSKKPSF